MTPVQTSLQGPVGVDRLARAWSLVYLNIKRLFLLRRVRRQSLEWVDGVPLVVLPGVLNPVVFRSGEFLARVIPRSSVAEARALDMGTGCGIGAIFAARRGYRVTAVDVNPDAVRCCRINAMLNGLENEIEVSEGDLFAPIAGRRFDLVLFNPPFFRGEPKSQADLAWRAAGLFERFAAGLPDVLAADGRALILLSTDGDAAGMLSALKGNGLGVEPVEQRNFGNEIMTVYCARVANGGE